MKITFTRASLLMAASLFSSYGHAVDVNTGDYDALPSGTNLAMVYLQYSEANDYYQQGKRQDGYLRTEMSITRLIHYTDINGMLVDPQILLPYGSVRGASVNGQSLGNATGFGDPIVGATFWVVNQPQAGYVGRYVGITPLLTLPLGNYDRHKAINIGENRYKFDLQLGWVEPLYKQLSLELFQDSVFYGHNNDAGSGNQTLKQHPTYELQTNLRYDFTRTQKMAVGYALYTGGRQHLDGDYNQTKTASQQARIEYQQLFAGHFQVSTQLIHDFDVKSGYKKDTGMNLRLLYLF
ncbi:transporter [Rosenbergiella nectarea]|uniref:transporter n=1 Tax=Rosenbergiella nectarea TaxID=988801 RepID=UPI001BDAF0E2|nr:transporter [Rosenbergiella nectarea]MBT0729214.1 transporter [Rosenbergiella nectarea subsp. apis]